MTVLVTGATGLLGSHLIDVLVERGECVRALVRPGEAVGAYAIRPRRGQRAAIGPRKE